FVPSRTFVTDSPEATVELGRQLANELSGVVLLIGNLGAGKTTLTKGIVEGRGAASAEAVSSPTFTLIHQYGGEKPVFHIDLYRLDEIREVESLGLDDLFRSGALVLLEWAERFPSLLPAERTEIRLRTLEDERREIVVS
ncbi:MAG TPA: tRNA (adenosine(37)-N6)-threonylcarbamoyltransferase complex ATPase subunit type 1 TsaE, partial [Bryobacteraceae bacterium]|nr:tRNA (adenosine(37)-N6)-threonylcarbamoyltransferase complex ATPase subunit type 1 TsaE [Bryobacteraceae bacterium]